MYFDAKEFGKRLHDVRTSRGITQEELAVRLGLASKQHVSRMENGELLNEYSVFKLEIPILPAISRSPVRFSALNDPHSLT